MPAPNVANNFPIVYKDKTYQCDQIEVNQSILYRVNFPGSPLHLTKARDQSGADFWTSIPHDPKVKEIVQELGAIITTQLKQ